MKDARSVRRTLGLLLLLLLAAVPAGARSLVIQKFEVTVVVNADGTLDVTETITPRFTGHYNGIYRDIPIEYHTPQGFNYTLFLEFMSATDGSGNPLKVESSRERHYRRLKIWIPGAEDTTRMFKLRYRVLDGLKFFEDHDELYWNVTGDEWDVPIEQASARIVLPEGTTGVRTLAYTGAYGARESEAEISTAGSLVEFRMRRVLSFHEGLTAVVGWDKGAVRAPTKIDETWLFLRSNWPLVLPLFIFAGMYWLWSTRGRDPQLRPIAAQYSPPEGLTPAEVGTLADNSADMRDITATIVDLAVRGYMKIEEKDEQHMMGLWSNKEYVFHLRKKRGEWSGLKEHEIELLDAMFETGTLDMVELSDLQNRFYTHLPRMRDRIFRALTNKGYYLHRPDNVKVGYLVGGAILGFLVAIGGSALSAGLGMAPLPFVLAGILSGLIVVIFAFFMPARTIAGARAFEGVRGFEDFLTHVEADRFERMVKTPEMFEKFLPFAMALGVDRRWANAFKDIYTQPPDWYSGPGYGPRFYPNSFVSNLNQMATRTAVVMASAPRSSGGSGFGGGGGGGSSGGGFGGGGGGGF